MAISKKQIDLTQEFRVKLREQLKTYQEAPEDIRESLDELWQSFKEVAEFDDDNQADLAGFGALAQFALLAEALRTTSYAPCFPSSPHRFLSKSKKANA